MKEEKRQHTGEITFFFFFKIYNGYFLLFIALAWLDVLLLLIIIIGPL